MVSLYSVWIYPFSLAAKGVRIAFFKSETDDKFLCYMYLPEDINGDLKGEDYTLALDQVCEIGKKALQEFGVDFDNQHFDIHVDVGDLDVADLEED